MRPRTKCPDGALQRTTGANEETDMSIDFQHHLYATCSELESRHLQKRCGLSPRHSRLIAGLCFGEVR